MPKNLILDIGHSEHIKPNNPLETAVAKVFCHKLQNSIQAKIKLGEIKNLVSVIVPESIIDTANANNALNMKMKWMNGSIMKYGNPDVTFSVHCNWSDQNKTASGWNIFYKNIETALDKPRAEASRKMAESIGDALTSAGFNSFGQAVCPDTMTAVQSLGVCTYIKAPSCLIELGFLSTPTDKNNLLDDTYITRMAEAALVGIRSYLNV